jgi:hypothetical protein
VSVANSIVKIQKKSISNFCIKISSKKQKQKNKKSKRVIHRKLQIFFLVFLYFQYFKYFRRLGDQSRTGVIKAKKGEFGVKKGEFGVKKGEFGVKKGVVL